MANKTFTVPEIPGSKRTSTSKIYTHAVLGEFNYDFAVEKAKQVSSSNAENYAYYQKLVRGEITYNDMESAHVERIFAQAKEVTSTYASAEEYATAMRDDRVARILKEQAESKGGYVLLGWSQSLQNAMNRFSEFSPHYKNFKVAEVVEVVKVKK